MRAVTKTRSRIATTAGIGLAIGVLSLTAASSAEAATATQTGQHTVCANSLTLYNNGPLATGTWGDEFYIDHFAGDGHVWGLLTHGSTTAYGWVYNGWFC
jgi:hypothetical protein